MSRSRLVPGCLTSMGPAPNTAPQTFCSCVEEIRGPVEAGILPTASSFGDEPRRLRFPGQPGLQELAELGSYLLVPVYPDRSPRRPVNLWQTRDAPPKGRSG